MSSSSLKIPGVLGRPDNLLWVDPSQVTIVPGENPRDEDLALDELKPLIAAQGFRQDRPISVYRDEDGTLKLIDGQRRLLCVRALIDAGQSIPRIPAILLPRMADPVERLISALAANRGKELSPMSEARAFARLLNFGWTPERIAQDAAGRSVSYVQARLALLEATPVVVEALQAGAIGVKAAVQMVRQAERNGIPQAVQLAQRTAAKAAKQAAPRPRTSEDRILGTLRKLEDDYGAALVLQVAQQFFGL